jgi:deoxycytidylate deaminase
LRAVYGERFVVFGVYAPRPRRRKALYDGISPEYDSAREEEWHDEEELRIDHLMTRDESEEGEAGQNVRDTFHRSDFFVNDAEGLRGAQVERCLRVLFGDYFVTPTRDESGMAHATIAAWRSAEPGRQVGAAIADKDGNIVSIGCNEVPKAFGGQYWPEDKGVEDGREFQKAPSIGGVRRDTNNTQQEAIADDLLAVLRQRLTDPLDSIVEAIEGLDIDDEKKTALRSQVELVARLDQREAILGSRLGDITEFGRAAHAEMAAITAASRLGVPLQDTILYSTTFPCHNCARHVIATGIRRLVYIAPYAKSQAYRLHEDALAVAPEATVKDKVEFEPFIGVAPRRYAHLFEGRDRKLTDGTINNFKPKEARPRLQDADPPEIGLDQLAYRIREDATKNAIDEFLSEAHPTLAQEDEKGREE